MAADDGAVLQDQIPGFVGEVQQVVVIPAVKILAVLLVCHGQPRTARYLAYFVFAHFSQREKHLCQLPLRQAVQEVALVAR